MPKYIVLYHMPREAMEASMENMTPEAMQENMAPWMAWVTECGDSLVDMGAPLMGGRAVTRGGVSPSDATASGYSMLEADDMDAAVALLNGHPPPGVA